MPSQFWGVLYSPFPRAKVTSLFGWRYLTRKNGTRFRNYHRGIDFAAAMDTPIRLAAPGVLFAKGFDPVIGYWAEFLLDDGTRIRYHMLIRPSQVAKGARLGRGAVIGHVGMSGSSATGPHLHVEVIRNGVPVNPLSVFTFSAFPAGSDSTPLENDDMPTVEEIWAAQITANGKRQSIAQFIADIAVDTAAIRKAVADIPVDVWNVKVGRTPPLAVIQELTNQGTALTALAKEIRTAGGTVDLDALANLIVQKLPTAATPDEIAAAMVEAFGNLFPGN